jgi:hypothetical protein
MPATALHRLARLRQWLAALLFVGFMLLPLADTLWGIAPQPPLYEKRTLHTKPTWNGSARALTRFPSAFEAYFNDTFGFRNLLTFAYNATTYYGLRESPSSQVILGSDGWLFYGAREEVRIFQRINPFPPDELDSLIHYFSTMQHWLSDRGIRLILAIPPNKSTIYGEHMPASYRRADGPSRLDQLIASGRERQLTIVDLREPFQTAKADAPMYYQLDTHWTPVAADLAVRAIAAHATDAHEPQPPPAWQRDTNALISGDLAVIMGLGAQLLEPTIRVDDPLSLAAVRTVQAGEVQGPGPGLYETDNTNGLTALLFHDSFMGASQGFERLATHFHRLVSVWQYEFDPKAIAQWQPDVVIMEFVERVLTQPSLLGDIPGILASLYDATPAVRYHRRVGSNVRDASSRIGTVRRAEAATPNGWLLFGRAQPLAPGAYDAVVRLRVDPPVTGTVARIEVTADRGRSALAEHRLTTASPDWQDLRLPFRVTDTNRPAIDCRIEFMGGGTLSVDYICIAPDPQPN